MNKDEINSIKLFTKYSILKDNTLKLTFLNDLFTEIDENNVKDVRYFLSGILEKEEDNFQVKTRIKTILNEISAIKQIELESKHHTEALKLKQSILEDIDRSDILLNRELLAYFREKRFDHFFSEVPFLNYTREDFRESIKNICESEPILGFILSKEPQLEYIYSQEKSIDSTVLNAPNSFKYVKEKNNYFPGLLISSDPTAAYIILIAEREGLRLISRPALNKKEIYTIFFPYSMIELKKDTQDKSQYLLIDSGKRVLILNILSKSEFDRLTDIISNYHFIYDSEDIFLNTIKYINTCLENSILIKKDIENFNKELKRIKDNALLKYKKDEDRESKLKTELTHLRIETVEKYRKEQNIVITSINIEEKSNEKNANIASPISSKVSMLLKRHASILTKKDGNKITCILDDADSAYRFAQALEEEMRELSTLLNRDISTVNLCIRLSVLRRKNNLFSKTLDELVELIDTLDENTIILDSMIAGELSDKSSLVLLHDKRLEYLQKEDIDYKFYKKI